MNAFNRDHLIWEQFLEAVEQFDISVIFETGTYKAQSTIDFADVGPVVYTVESRKTFWEEAQDNIKASDAKGIISLLGDSPTLIQKMVPELVKQGQNILFFLDAHWYDDNCLERELQTLSRMNFYTNQNHPVILIHDAKVPSNPEYGFDVYNGRAISFAWIKNYADKIYGEHGHSHWFNKGISEKATHNRGCLFIAPKRLPK